MKFTRARDLLITGVVVGVLVNLLLLVSYDSLPPLPTLGGLTLLVLAVIEGLAAIPLRSRIAGKPGSQPLAPLTAVRVVALAKASSLLGAIMCGAWLGVLVYVLPKRSQMIAASGDTASGVVGALSAAALIAAALWLEYICRAPIDRDRQNGENTSTHSD